MSEVVSAPPRRRKTPPKALRKCTGNLGDHHCRHPETHIHAAAMSRPTLFPIRLATQCSRQSSTRCLRQPQRQRHAYLSLDDQRRGFATTQPRCASAVKQMKPTMKQPAQPSMSRTQKEQQNNMARMGQLPEDVGLLPDTFILPRKPSERYSWRLRKKWFKTRFWEIVK